MDHISIDENLANRDSERVISQFIKSTQYSMNFIKHSSDQGVIRNGGRRGSAFGPQAILNAFKKLAITNQEHAFRESEICESDWDQTDFDLAQKKSSEKILFELQNITAKKNVFLGGGHDHILPTLWALEKVAAGKKIVVVNIDPHLDLRNDQLHNSGTPFRQFDNSAKNDFELIQIGTHQFSNVPSSMTPLKKGKMRVVSFEELRQNTKNFSDNFSYLAKFFPVQNNSDSIYFLSIDIDALESSTMEAVSAVNPRGVPPHFVEDLVDYFNHSLMAKFFGLYEYNPLYENLSQKGARFIVSLIHRMLKNEKIN
jgi:formiminoglutamase